VQTHIADSLVASLPWLQVAKAKPSTPFLQSHWAAWGAVAALSLGLTIANPGQFGMQAALPFNLACTLLGFLLGNAMPKGVQVRGQFPAVLQSF
jgi:predicted lipid-binding transport protein (Tim44 family)